MKRFILAFSFVLIGTNLASAQQFDYKQRNHKLNKNYVEDLQDKNHEFTFVRKDVDRKVNDYLARNAKFHKQSAESILVSTKKQISYDYRELNHKLNRKSKYNMFRKPPVNRLITKNKIAN